MGAVDNLVDPIVIKLGQHKILSFAEVRIREAGIDGFGFKSPGSSALGLLDSDNRQGGTLSSMLGSGIVGLRAVSLGSLGSDDDLTSSHLGGHIGRLV